MYIISYIVQKMQDQWLNVGIILVNIIQFHYSYMAMNDYEGEIYWDNKYNEIKFPNMISNASIYIFPQLLWLLPAWQG